MSDNNSSCLYPRQTNTALYQQLHEQGFGTQDLLVVQHTYRLACRLFNGRYRKTERPFICHVVGAASVVAHFESRLDLIQAALLHATYDSGQFPDGRIGKSTTSHRTWLTSQVGPEVESLVFRSRQLPFDEGDPETLLESQIDELDQDCLLLALTHELDDLADGGLSFARKYGASIESRIEACVALARKLHRGDLADALQSYRATYQDVGWIEELRSKTNQGYHIAPNLKAYIRLRRNHSRGKDVDVH